MDPQFLAFIFLALCVLLLYRLWRARDVVDFQLGVVAAFSIGYFCLPVWFERQAKLESFPQGEVAQALLIFLAFLFCVLIGTWLGRRWVPESLAFETERLDAVIAKRGPLSVVVAFGWYIYYYFTHELTSYEADNFSAYFENNTHSLGSVMTKVLADLALSWIAFDVVMAMRERRRARWLLYASMLACCTSLLLLVGQRLAFLTPIVVLMALFSLTGQKGRANGSLGLGVVALLLVSPIAVAVREAPDDTTSTEVISSFSYGDSPIETMFQSIIDRGDLLYVAVRMKPHLDADPLPGPIYYASVLVNPVPSALYPFGAKPYLLSTNGDPSGELSIMAWDTLRGGGTGSLSAFGGLVAYRELGWAGVLLNGVATGLLFVALWRWLGRGGVLPMLLYAGLFVDLSVKKVPPSFWEALSALMPMLPILVGIYLLERALPAKAPSRTTSTTRV